MKNALGLSRERMLSFATEAVWCYAELAVAARNGGRGFPTPDGYIAAIAASRGFIVASRDTAPFEAAGVAVVNRGADIGSRVSDVARDCLHSAVAICRLADPSAGIVLQTGGHLHARCLVPGLGGADQSGSGLAVKPIASSDALEVLDDSRGSAMNEACSSTARQ